MVSGLLRVVLEDVVEIGRASIPFDTKASDEARSAVMIMACMYNREVCEGRGSRTWQLCRAAGAVLIGSSHVISDACTFASGQGIVKS